MKNERVRSFKLNQRFLIITYYLRDDVSGYQIIWRDIRSIFQLSITCLGLGSENYVKFYISNSRSFLCYICLDILGNRKKHNNYCLVRKFRKIQNFALSICLVEKVTWQPRQSDEKSQIYCNSGMITA